MKLLFYVVRPVNTVLYYRLFGLPEEKFAYKLIFVYETWHRLTVFCLHGKIYIDVYNDIVRHL